MSGYSRTGVTDTFGVAEVGRILDRRDIWWLTVGRRPERERRTSKVANLGQMQRAIYDGVGSLSIHAAITRRAFAMFQAIIGGESYYTFVRLLKLLVRLGSTGETESGRTRDASEQRT